jgi:hypothetical protein
LLSISVSTDRPLERADAIIDESIESLTLVAYSRAKELFEPPWEFRNAASKQIAPKGFSGAPNR